VPDILSQGGDREPGPWPRRIAVATALALVAAAIAYYLPRSRHETAQPARPTATAVPGQSVTRVGLADAVAPGVAGTLWLTSYPPGADPRIAAGVAREVSRAGRPSGSQVTLPAGYLIERGTGRGLLLAPVARGPGTMADERPYAR
jgi:hypothetical protein